MLLSVLKRKCGSSPGPHQRQLGLVSISVKGIPSLAPTAWSPTVNTRMTNTTTHVGQSGERDGDPDPDDLDGPDEALESGSGDQVQDGQAEGRRSSAVATVVPTSATNLRRARFGKRTRYAV